MADDGIPREVKQFILERIDSVELLEVLFLMRSTEDQQWSAQKLSDELRANPSSITKRLGYLEKLSLIQENEKEAGIYSYAPRTMELRNLIYQLYETYKVRRTTVLGLIFSPMKKAVDLASAFELKKDEDDHG